MKRAIVFIMISVFLFNVTFSTASGAITTTWTPLLQTIRTSGATNKINPNILDVVAQLNADLLTFEGLLEAYSISGDLNVYENVFFVSDEISVSLEALNSELTNIYKDLNMKQQSTVKDAYLSLSSYLKKLSEEANLIFQDEDGKAKAKFEVQEIGIIFENLPNQLWVGSAVSV